MFNASITRFVDSYANQNPEFYNFTTSIVVDALPNSMADIFLKPQMKKIHELSIDELKSLYAPLIDIIGGSNRRRHFVIYHHLVGLGIKLS
jgi:hypothetical protein